MAALHEALTNLSPIEWTDVPQDNLEPFVDEILSSAELICSSVPPPPNGTSYEESQPANTTPNIATSHKDMQPSAARSLPSHEEYEELQSQWGKPMKFSTKENPLEISIYKMAGKDRHGGWFARRSVHEGMGFTKFKDAMKREFEESLKVEGGPGAGCIRGIGADKRLEDIDTKGTKLEVYQLSAQFPGPTTPREFITLLLTSDSALSEKSVAGGVTSSTIPRHYIIVSRPVKHSNAPERSGHIRGQYESVELIREIKLNATKSISTPNLLATDGQPTDAIKRSTTDAAHPGQGEDTSSSKDELNPVEWIMITRSDPGGGIPRFMVDRGTPSAMIGDVHKFLDWAAKGNDDSAPIPQATTEETPSSQERAVTTDEEPQTQELPRGVFHHITQALEAGLDAYAPSMISSFVHDKLDPYDDSDDLTSDAESFRSATEKEHPKVAALRDDTSESISLASLNVPPSEAGDKKKLDSHEKKLLELNKEREKLDARLARKREEEESKFNKAQEDEDHEASRARERYEKEIKKQEEKHRKELEKLEAKKEKEAKKLEQKRRKALERDALYKVTRERDEFRDQVDLLKRENAILRERIEQFESTVAV